MIDPGYGYIVWKERSKNFFRENCFTNFRLVLSFELRLRQKTSKRDIAPAMNMAI